MRPLIHTAMGLEKRKATSSQLLQSERARERESERARERERETSARGRVEEEEWGECCYIYNNIDR